MTKPGRRSSLAEPASVLLEAVLAAATAGVALALIAPMFAKQIELARRARDMDQLDVVVNKDVNTISHYARLWRLKSSVNSYPDPSFTKTAGYKQSSISTYDNNAGDECANKSSYASAFISDLSDIPKSELNNRPRLINEPVTMALPASLASRYVLKRSLDVVNETFQPTVRLTYTLDPAVPDAPTLAFHRTAEFHRSAQFWC